MRATDQTAFDFISESPGRPKKAERIFVGVFPDTYAAKAIETVARNIAGEVALGQRLLERGRYHVSLAHISDRDRLRSRDEFAFTSAARLVQLPAFDVSLSQAGSVRGPPRRGGPPLHPLVLLADKGPIADLFDSLGGHLRNVGVRVGGHFTPHITLAYSTQFVSMRTIEPIRFTVREFVLIHSERGRTKYNVLRKCPLS